MRVFGLQVPLGTVVVITAVGLYSQPAAAYLDPGTGSVLLQGLIGAIAAAAFTMKLYWHKFKALFRRNGNRDEPENSQSKKSSVDK